MIADQCLQRKMKATIISLYKGFTHLKQDTIMKCNIFQLFFTCMLQSMKYWISYYRAYTLTPTTCFSKHKQSDRENTSQLYIKKLHKYFHTSVTASRPVGIPTLGITLNIRSATAGNISSRMSRIKVLNLQIS